MSNRKCVYVAGPITGNPLVNMGQAIEAGQALIDAGFAPLVPHLTVYWDLLHNPGENSWETWLETDLPWVSKADAVLRLPGESPGADREVALAYRLDIPVFHDIQHLVLWFASSEAKEPENSIPAKSEFQTDTEEHVVESRGPTEALPTAIHRALGHITSTFAGKSKDYAADSDWQSNFKDIAQQLDIEPIDAVETLIAVKQARLRSLRVNGRTPQNESVLDTRLDRAVYAVIALAMALEVSV